MVRKNILASTVGLLGFLREDPRLWWGALVTSWFWLVGAVALSLMPPLVKNVLGGNEDVVTTCLAIFSVSIAIGSGSGFRRVATIGEHCFEPFNDPPPRAQVIAPPATAGTGTAIITRGDVSYPSTFVRENPCASRSSTTT